MDMYGKITAFQFPLLMQGGLTVNMTGNSDCFMLSDCCLPNEECQLFEPIVKYNAAPGTILSTLPDDECDPPCQPTEGITGPIENRCVQQMIGIAQHNAQEIYADMMWQMRADFKAAYMKKCLEAAEQFNVKYTGLVVGA